MGRGGERRKEERGLGERHGQKKARVINVVKARASFRKELDRLSKIEGKKTGKRKKYPYFAEGGETCPLSPNFGLWMTLEIPDWGLAS